ncbi:alpha/beta fold hydrolase [Leisingera thetidis]|uniref:alpha/beta fold hydrolase n=1 Tax=Leisingera thetidis TaxID=2930199 RepID=UPI0021F798E0|nr:hypothetical protein [Leisingera thetidis]
MTFETQVVRANGNDFSCWLEGEGDKDVVFIHGEIHGKAYWEPQIREFMKDHRCLWPMTGAGITAATAPLSGSRWKTRPAICARCWITSA